MKTFNQSVNNVLSFLLKIILVIILALGSCYLLDFMLVPPVQTSKIGTIMEEIEMQDENIDIMFLGSSRTYRSVDAYYLTQALGENVFNVASDSVTYCSLYHLLVELCKTNSPKTVLLECSSANFKRETGFEDAYIYQLLSGQNQLDYQTAIDYTYIDSELINFVNYLENFSNGKFIENIIYKVSSSDISGSVLDTAKSTYIGNGFIYADAELEEDEEVWLAGSYFSNGEFWGEHCWNENALIYFYKILDFCNENNIEVLLYYPPFPSAITEKYYKDFEKFSDSVEEFIKDYSNIKVLDFSKIKLDYFELEIPYFFDGSHVNGDGASILRTIIEDIYLEIENNTYNESEWFYEEYEELFADYGIILEEEECE